MMDDTDLIAAFREHTRGKDKFTRRMAIHLGYMDDRWPMSMVWRLEKMGLLKKGSYEWFKDNGGIPTTVIEEVLGSPWRPTKYRAGLP